MAEPTEADRERARSVLRFQLGAEDVERVATALADERERAQAPFLELAEELERNAVEVGYPYGEDFQDAADRIRRAAEETGQ